MTDLSAIHPLRQRMIDDMTLRGFGLSTRVRLFFVGYLMFQIPADLMLVRIGARRWIFSITAIWDLISASSVLVQGPASFAGAPL